MMIRERKINVLNSNLAKVTERYRVMPNSKMGEIELFDHSLDEVVFKADTIKNMTLFVDGFVLGRETQG
jgi:hypothetical protein